MTLGVEARLGALFERQPALAEVERAVKAAAGGQGSAVVVRGPAGIGKTTLLEEAARRVRRQGMHVLVARGTRLEREFAFGVVRQLFDPLLMRAGRQRRERMFGGAARLADPLFGMDGPASSGSTSGLMRAASRFSTGYGGCWGTSPPSSRWGWWWTTCTGATALVAVAGVPGAAHPRRAGGVAG